MTKEYHLALHAMLHNNLDALFADYIAHHRHIENITETSVMELLAWSYTQTINPQLAPDCSHSKGH